MVKAPSRYRADLCSRVKAARESVNVSQQEMASMLGTSQVTYSKWEVRSAIPHHHVGLFCRITDSDPWYLLTGEPPHLAPGNPKTKKAG